jgi:hypothetical protein
MKLTPLQAAIAFCDKAMDDERSIEVPSGCSDSNYEAGCQVGRLEAYMAIRERLEELLPDEVAAKKKVFHAGHCVQILENEKGVKYTEAELFESYLKQEHNIISR